VDVFSSGWGLGPYNKQSVLYEVHIRWTLVRIVYSIWQIIKYYSK